MTHLGYSELTKRLYILPASKKAVKVDITNDVAEYMRATIGESVYIPCFEDDPDMIGGFTSTDGRSLCYLKEIKL